MYDDILGERIKKTPRLEPKDIIDVQPMTTPQGKVFHLKCEHEASPSIPFTIRKMTIEEKPRKLKAKWTFELENEENMFREELFREVIRNLKIELGYDILKDMNEC